MTLFKSAQNELLLNEWISKPFDAFSLFIESEDFIRTGASRCFYPEPIKKSSAETYTFMFSRFVSWTKENTKIPIPLLKSEQISHFLDEVDSTTSSALRWRYLRLIERVYSNLEYHGVISENPVSSLVQERINTKGRRSVAGVDNPTEWISNAETHQLKTTLSELTIRDSLVTNMGHWKNCRDVALTSIILGAGLKTAEALALTKSDIGFHDNTCVIDISKGFGTGLSRIARVQAFASDYIQLWLNLNTDNETMFPGIKGNTTPMDHATAYRRVKKIFSAAHIPIKHAGCRSLRNTFAAELISNGVDLELVTEKMGLRENKSVKRYQEKRASRF